MYADPLEAGYACLRRGDPEAARSRFQHVIDTDPTRPQGYFALAQSYLEQGLLQETREALEAALRLDPTYVAARAYLAIELLKTYQIDEAQQELEHALRDEPANLLVHIKYADYYYRLGFYNRSVEMLERGLGGPHGANEHVVAMARKFLAESRQKSKNIILREIPDPRNLSRFFSGLPFWKRKHEPQGLQSS